MVPSPSFKATLADEVEKNLLLYLKEHHLQPGDLLPRETDLAESLQVSRHIVREAISRLAAMGLVESRKHRGTAFRRPEPFSGFQKLAEAGMFTPQDRQDFMELRVAMELGMSDFIFLRRTPEKIAELRKLAGRAGTKNYAIRAELDFHSRLMAFAENPAAEDFRKVLSMAFGTVQSHNRKTVVSPSHQAICNELERGSAESFRQIMRDHLLLYLEKTEEAALPSEETELPKVPMGKFLMDREKDRTGNLSVATRRVTTETASVRDFREAQKEPARLLAEPSEEA